MGQAGGVERTDGWKRSRACREWMPACGNGIERDEGRKSGLAPAASRTYCAHVNDLVLTLPGDALANARIPRSEMERELRRRLAAALFSDGIVGGAAACQLAGMEKAEFQHWLGERGLTQPLAAADYEQERENLESWLGKD